MHNPHEIIDISNNNNNETSQNATSLFILSANKSSLLTTFVISTYSIIFLLGTIGNTLILTVVLRNPSMHTVTNIFIANLALSDILMCIVAVPFTPLALLIDEWMLPDIFCQLLPMTMAVSVYVSTLTSLAISIDRYFVIVQPFKPRMKIPKCYLIILTIWIIAILSSLPLALFHECQYDLVTNTTKCIEKWPPNTNIKQTFTIISFIMQFIIPSLIISFSYYRIFNQLQNRCKRQKLRQSFNNKSGKKPICRSMAEIQRKRKTNKMLIAMVSIFIACWIPLNALWIATDLIYKIEKIHLHQTPYFELIFIICHMIAMSSTFYNAFLYGWMNDNFRQEFCSILGCLGLNRFSSMQFDQNSTFRRNSNHNFRQPVDHLLMNEKEDENDTKYRNDLK